MELFFEIGLLEKHELTELKIINRQFIIFNRFNNKINRTPLLHYQKKCLFNLLKTYICVVIINKNKHGIILRFS